VVRVKQAGGHKWIRIGIIGASLILAAGVFKASVRPEAAILPAACGQQPRSQAEAGGFAADSIAWWNGQQITPLSQELPAATALATVLGEATGEEKWIEVDLTNQRIKAHEGDRVVYDFPMSSGKFVKTPTGEYRIWSKFKYTKMEGGVKGTGTYYYLPNVPYTMYFYQGFGIHGTYWHNNFGTPMSHGCVNVAIPHAEKLFYWAGPAMDAETNALRATTDNPGARVVVHGKTPVN